MKKMQAFLAAVGSVAICEHFGIAFFVAISVWSHDMESIDKMANEAKDAAVEDCVEILRDVRPDAKLIIQNKETLSAISNRIDELSRELKRVEKIMRPFVTRLN